MLLVAAGCTATHPPVAIGARPLSPDPTAVRRELDAFGRKLYAALTHGRPEGVLLDEAALRALLVPAAAERSIARRAYGSSVPPVAADARALLGAASYAGICVQQGRIEPEGGTLGLRHAGFLFERALLVGKEPGGGAVASWVEGRFVHTNAGFAVLGLERLEPPRRDHADLDLAVCELRAGAFGHNP